MKKLPNSVKWFIILVVLAVMGWMMWAVNDRASRVEMPAPDNTFGIYRTSKTKKLPGMGSFFVCGSIPARSFRWRAGRS